jgi:hypothetical protein
MPRRSHRIVIDARPRGPGGTLAEVSVRGTSVLERLVGHARGLGGEPVVCAAPDEQGRLGRLLDGRCEFVAGPPPADAVVLRTDRLYDPARLRRALRGGRDPETAVIWRLDTPQGLAGAEQELARRESYQPLGRYWALAPARALARALAPTRVRPNAVTLAAAALMLAAAGAVAGEAPGPAARVFVAAALALALVLDTADGHLARLQGTASEFGRWLDAYLDELADMALHAAIAWGAFVRDAHPGWLLIGMLYAMGKYQFLVATTPSAPEPARRDAEAAPTQPGATPRASRLAAAVRLAGHADVRWHLWIVLAAAGRLDAALAAYAFYFPARAFAVAVKKGVRRG